VTRENNKNNITIILIIYNYYYLVYAKKLVNDYNKYGMMEGA
jgi:hypothetical protein